jgi:hypothetical protein
LWPRDANGPARGNRYGAVNLVTFADRVARAWDRQRMKYPSVARASLLADELVKIEGAPMDVEDANGCRLCTSARSSCFPEMQCQLATRLRQGRSPP